MSEDSKAQGPGLSFADIVSSLFPRIIYFRTRKAIC